MAITNDNKARAQACIDDIYEVMRKHGATGTFAFVNLEHGWRASSMRLEDDKSLFFSHPNGRQEVDRKVQAAVANRTMGVQGLVELLERCNNSCQQLEEVRLGAVYQLDALLAIEASLKAAMRALVGEPL